MEKDLALAQIRDALTEGRAAELFSKLFPLRHHARSTYALALTTATQLPTAMDYSTSRAELDVDPAAAREAVLAWITPDLTPVAARMMSILFTFLDPAPMTRQDFVSAVAARAPALTPYAAESLALGSRSAQRYLDALEPVIAAALRDNLRAQRAHSSTVDLLGVEGRAVVLDGWAETEATFPTHQLRDYAPAARLNPAGFTALARRALEALNKRDVSRYFVELGALDADAVASILRAVRSKEAHFERAAFNAARAGTPAAAEALARFLSDNARGRDAARWLCLMGDVGREALSRVAASTGKTKADQRSRDLAGEALAIPGATAMLVAIGNQPSGWSLDASRYIVDPLPPLPTGEPPRAPTPLAELSRVIDASEVRREDLSADGWSDLLQLTTVLGWRDDRDAAYALLLSQKRLGWGGDPGHLYDALDRFDIDQTVSASYGGKGVGLGHMLLGMGAPREAWLHAIGCAAARRKAIALGVMGRHFESALEGWGHPDGPTLAALVRHVELVRTHGVTPDEITRYPAVETASEVAGAWRSEGRYADLRLRASVTGATTVTLKVRQGIAVTVDIAARRWSQVGLDGPSEGATTLFGGERVVQVDLELVGAAARIAVNGTHTLNGPKGHLYEKVKRAEGPAEVETDGRVARVTITPMLGMRAATDVVSVAGFGEERSLKDLLQGQDAVTAHALAVAARFGANDGVRAAAEDALRKAGPWAAPWREALGLERVEAKPGAWAPVSFDECVKRFERLTAPRKVKVAEGVQGFAKAAAVKNPASPKWGRGAVSEDSLYLTPAKDWRAEALKDAQSLVQSGMPAVTTWNSRGTGAWAGKAGEWLIVTCDDLAQEQSEWETMSFTFAAWKLTDGVALAAWKGDPESLAAVMGLPDGLPPREAWTSMKIWIGE